VRVAVRPDAHVLTDALRESLLAAATDHPLDPSGVLGVTDCLLQVDNTFPPPTVAIDATEYPKLSIRVPILCYPGLSQQTAGDSQLTRDLRHELTHAIDRQSPAFGMDQQRWEALPSNTRSTAYSLWDVWIDARLDRAGFTVQTIDERRAEWLGTLRARLSSRERAVMMDLWTRELATFAEIMALAEELTPIREAACARALRRPGWRKRLRARMVGA